MATDEADIATLCQTVKGLIPPELGPESWYLPIAAILAQSTKPQYLASLYTHLTTNDTSFSTDEAKLTLSLRFRDILLKQVTLVGAPQVLCALMPLAKVDCSAYGHQDTASAASASTLSQQWHDLPISTIHARGTKTIDTIYGSTLLPKIFASFGAHSADTQFMELFTVYGLYLSEHTHLTPLETELVVWTTIMCLGWKGPATWHMRGMGRLLGARGSDESTEEMNRVKDALRNIKVAAMEVVEWLGPEMVGRSALEADGEGGRGWPNVGDVVRDLGGWGDDEVVK